MAAWNASTRLRYPRLAATLAAESRKTSRRGAS